MKSILNYAPVPPDEVKEIVNSIQNDNAVKSLNRIMKVYTQSHLYLSQWKALRVDIEHLKRVIGMIRRFETSGLQLDGKGLWLLVMLLENSCENLTIDESTFTVLFDTLLRVAVETSAYTICTSTLYLLITKFNASCGKLFQTGYCLSSYNQLYVFYFLIVLWLLFFKGCAIADHLPDSIPADNFVSILSFVQVCIEYDRSCALLACKFLVYLAANVTPNHKVNYFLPSVVRKFGVVFLEDSQEERDQPELKREIEVYILVLLKYLAPLHPTHAHIIMNHAANLPSTIVRRLEEESLSEAGESAALLFLDSLCIDTNAKDQLRTMISIKLVRSKMKVFSPTVTEKATKLFLSLYANDIECNYRARSSVDLRESRSWSNLSRLSEDSGGAGFGVGGGGLSTKSARSDRSYSLTGVTCLRDLLGIVLTITEAALHAQAQEGNDTATQGEENAVAADEPTAETTRISTSAAFHYMNSIVYQVGLYVQIHRIYSLHDVVARIVALILSQFDRMDKFDLKNAKIIDTLFILIGMRERCWQPFAADVIDTDFVEMSSALLEHFVNIADPVVTDANSDFNMPCSPETRDFTTSNLLNSKVINFAKDKFLQSSEYLENFLEEWEVESIEGISRRLLLIYCKVQLGGLEAVAGLLDLELFQEMLWDVMTDERHGLDAYPEMKRKCIQLFTAVGMHLNSPAGAIAGSAAASPVNNNNYNTQGSGKIPPTPKVEEPPKQLSNAGPLAEFVIKILCSHEHASATDEDDELALNSMHLNSNLSSKIGIHNNPPASGAADLGGLNGKSEGGKCVSRIFRTHKHNVQLRYSCLSSIMYICEHNRAVRRKVIASYAEIASNFSYLDAVHSMPPLLHLVALASEYLTKVESAGEESIVTLIVRALSNPDAVVRTLACDVISVIGASSPGLMHRGICRPEIEHLLLDILQTACAEEEHQQHTGPLVRSVLKACNALTHDINVRPCWVPSPYTYHWSRYSMNLATRPLFVVSFLDTLQLVVRRASRTYIIHYFAVVLSIVTCLMYSCNDGVFGPAIPKSSPTHVAELKAALIEKFLPWMPIALDYLTSFKKILRSMLTVPLISENGSTSGSTPSSPTGQAQLQQNGGGGSAKGGSASASSSERLPEQVVQDKEAAAKDTNKSSTQKAGLNIMNRIKLKPNANVVIVESVVLPDKKQDVKYSPGAEYLAEKLIEALHAFLCMDEMFPLSTYLHNAALFSGTPVIACVSYFMTECKGNLKVQRRGIDFVKHFADNQIGLSSIAMHSPSAIMHAARSLSDTLEVQYSFCKIVSAVARSDDFARENFIRFNVQSLLVELVLRQHPEQSKLACLALTDLCTHDTDAIAVCQSAGVVDAVLALLDSMPSDFKIQVEGVRVLVTVDQVPELLSATRKLSVSQILKRTKKFLTAAMKQEQLPDHYEKGDVEALLASPIWAKDPLLTKIMGFFG